MSFWGMSPWIVWCIIAVIFFIAEVFIPGFWMAIIGIGAIGAAITSVLSGNFALQLAVLSILSIISGIFFRPFAMKYIYGKSESKPVNVDALIGKKVPVIQKITFVTPGKVKIGSEVWKAVTTDEKETFEIGDIIVVSSIDGAKIVVRRDTAV